MWSQRKHSLNAGIANLFANSMDYSEPFTSYVDKYPEKRKMTIKCYHEAIFVIVMVYDKNLAL